MTPQQQTELEQATWNVDVVNPGVKLYLLALIRSGDHEDAALHAGLTASDAAIARGWLTHLGVIDDDGTVDADGLKRAQTERPVSVSAGA
jgi:hypothetical protein